MSKLSKDAIEAIGWAYADACAELDRGADPRKAEMPRVLARARVDLADTNDDRELIIPLSKVGTRVSIDYEAFRSLMIAGRRLSTEADMFQCDEGDGMNLADAVTQFDKIEGSLRKYEERKPPAKGGIVKGPLPRIGEGHHLDPVAQLMVSKCRSCERRLADDQTALIWRQLATICEFKGITRHASSRVDAMYERPICHHGAAGQVYRCCRLMCPVWDDLTGRHGPGVNTVGLEKEVPDEEA